MRPDTAFREQRWLRAGATDEQLAELRDAHTAMTVDEQAAEGQRIDGVSDEDLAAELATDAADIIAGTRDEILERVGDDAELAAVALSHEQARARPRKTLIEGLQAVIGGSAEDG